MPMTTARSQARQIPRLNVSTAEIRSHLITAQAAACPGCGAYTVVLAGDIALLLAEITRLHHALIRTRRKAANFEAAIRATIGAQEDGEHDPIGYLRDELTPDAGGACGA